MEFPVVVNEKRGAGPLDASSTFTCESVPARATWGGEGKLQTIPRANPQLCANRTWDGASGYQENTEPRRRALRYHPGLRRTAHR